MEQVFWQHQPGMEPYDFLHRHLGFFCFKQLKNNLIYRPYVMLSYKIQADLICSSVTRQRSERTSPFLHTRTSLADEKEPRSQMTSAAQGGVDHSSPSPR